MKKIRLLAVAIALIASVGRVSHATCLDYNALYYANMMGCYAFPPPYSLGCYYVAVQYAWDDCDMPNSGY
jgi:hypothetical protein